MKTMRLVCIFALILGAFSLCLAAEAKRIATIAEIKGSAEVKTSTGAWAKARVGMVLNEGDTVRTKANSSILLNLDGKAQTATVQIKEKSQLTLAELVGDKEKDTQNTLLDLSLGAVLIQAQKIHSQQSRFEVKTPTSVVGVRGTTFSVAVEAIE
jgi:hypothetical protein